MYRRIISSCVLAGFLIAQWAAIPHAHAQGNPLDHDATSHVHLAPASAASHGHTHGHNHCHAIPAVAVETNFDDSGLSDIAEHDADAVYLSSQLLNSASSGVEHGKAFMTLLIFDALHSSLFVDTLTDNLVAASHPSHDYAPSCALYLALRTLRI